MRENEPEMLKCGSFMLGRDRRQFAKKFLMLSRALRMCSFAASMGAVIADLMLFHTDVVVLLIVKSVMIDLSEVFLIFTALPQVQSREYHVDIHRAKD